MRVYLAILWMFALTPIVFGQEQRSVHIMPRVALENGDSIRLQYYLSATMEMERYNADSAMAQYFRIFMVANDVGYKEGMDSTLAYVHRCVYRNGSGPVRGRILQDLSGYADDDRIDRNLRVLILHDAAVTALYQDQYVRAGYYLRKALSLFGVNDQDSTSISLKQLTYATMGSLWSIMHEDRHALTWMRKAEQLAQTPAEKAAVAVNRSSVYFSLGHWDSAHTYALDALALENEHDQDGTTSAAYLNLAQVLISKGKPKEALKYLDLGFARRQAAQRRRIEKGETADVFYPNDIKYLYLRGKALMHLNDYEQAKRYLFLAYYNQKQFGFRGDLMETLELLSATSAELKNYKDAWTYHLEHKQITDSLALIEKSRTVDAEIRFLTAEKDRELALKQLSLIQSQNKIRNKNTLLIGVSAGGVLLASFLFAMYRNSLHRQRLNIERMRLMQQDQEIGNLKAMMEGEEKERARLARELHDGIMVQLSTVKMRLRTLARKRPDGVDQNELEETLQQLDYTTRELRRSAHSLMPDMLLEGGLAEAVFYFCKNLATGSTLRINFQQYGNIPRMQPEFEIALYRIVQELVQNIIKHAEATKGLIQFNCREGMLYITVEDNGKGFDIKMNGHEGMGLKSIRTRLRALNGIMDISSHRQSGTAVNLEFDIRSVTIPENEHYAY